MDKDQQELKEFLEQQLQWFKKQDAILQQIDEKLHEMKIIAEYRLEHELVTAEIEALNRQLIELKQDIHDLENQLRDVVH
jgi:predicted  nucleic acid-binding Zn-ribbon protein